MPRPKGSKNKSTLEREQTQDTVVVEFDYERDDVRFDTSYNPLSVTGSTDNFSVTLSDPPTFLVEPTTTFTLTLSDPPTFLVEPTTTFTPPTSNKMFLVEGDVRLNSNEGAVVAKQFRLVMADNEETAIRKYANYFQGLSDQQSVYTVVSAAAMETIV